MREVITPNLHRKLLWGHIKNISNKRVYIYIYHVGSDEKCKLNTRIKTSGYRLCGRRRRKGETTILKWILKIYIVKMLTVFN
jgi:hypothetical protein